MRLVVLPLAGLSLAGLLLATPALAQFGPAGPPAVGVVTVEQRAVTESEEFTGRIQATDRVDIVARVNASLVARSFTEGGEVAAGQVLYRLERAPFEADLAAKQAAAAQTEALLRNATIALGRARSLLNTPAGQRAAYDDAVAQEASLKAQLDAARAQAEISRINLGYTEIRAPVAGRIGRSAVAPGNIVGPGSGTLASIVSQDPMYVLFPVPTRTVTELRDRYAGTSGWGAVAVKVRLPDGHMYGETGRIDYADPSVSQATDTIMLRAALPNPLRPGARPGDPGSRDLVDGAFVSVLVEGAKPVQALVIPRAAVALDQQGAYVYVVDADKKVELRRVRLGAPEGTLVVVTEGLKAGESIVLEGLQRVRPGIAVNPAPAGAAKTQG
jgi:membrane fusion protein (multidrug efflux system)